MCLGSLGYLGRIYLDMQSVMLRASTRYLRCSNERPNSGIRNPVRYPLRVWKLENNFARTMADSLRKKRRREDAGVAPDIKIHQPDRENVDKPYFEGYSNIGIHQDMLKDRARTEAYRDAILEVV